MNRYDWHWAQLKQGLEITDPVFLAIIKAPESFVLPAGALVYVADDEENGVDLTLDPSLMNTVFSAFMNIPIEYSSLLEPLEDVAANP